MFIRFLKKLLKKSLKLYTKDSRLSPNNFNMKNRTSKYIEMKRNMDGEEKGWVWIQNY